MLHTKEVRLVFQIDEFFKRAKSGTIWGTVYFEDGGGWAFPDRGWTDIVAGFVRAWLNALVRIADGISSTENVAFYDGPMEIELNARGNGIIETVFLCRDEQQFTAEQEMLGILINSVRIGEKLIAACEERQWHDNDTVAVMSSLTTCRGLVARYKEIT